MKKGLTQIVSNLCFQYGGPGETRTPVRSILAFIFYMFILSKNFINTQRQAENILTNLIKFFKTVQI